MKTVMMIEDLKTPSILGRDPRQPEAVVTLGCTMRFDIDRCKHVDLLRGCFVQVIQQDLAVRQWDKNSGVQNQAPRLDVNVVCRITAIENAVRVP